MQVQQNFSLKKYNTFGIDAAAKYFSIFSSVDELENILSFIAKEQISSNKQFILGGGSNILFTKNYQAALKYS